MEKIGYNQLIDDFELTVLEQPLCSYIGTGSTLTRESTRYGWEVHYPERFRTDGSWQAQLLFAIKHEGVNLEVLKALFAKIDSSEMAALVLTAPHGIYIRRLWFLYEFLTGDLLPVPALKSGNYNYVLPPDEYFCIDKELSWHAKRQRLFCNLPGNTSFCPIVRLTSRILEFQQKNLASKVTEAIAAYPSELIYRASSFFYLKETKSSYAIERQTPSQKRAAAFIALLRDAGRSRLDKSLLLQLQNAIVEERYRESDYRQSQVYVGQTLAPDHELIHFVGMKPGDLPQMMTAYLESAEKILNSSCDAIISAAVLSFAFVFIHPFEDGNGRLHRYLLHHILNAKGFNPENIIFPVSALLYKDAKLYDGMLENFSKRLLPQVEYHLAGDGAMTVYNDTADFYRYVDFTRIVEDFFGVVEATLKTELVPELNYLVHWERVRQQMRDIVDMPDRKADQFVLFVQQNHGDFPKRRRNDFEELSDDEITALTKIIKEELCTLNTQK